ncbi:MAG: RNA-binding protein [Chthoniobacter sp.]
MSFFRPAPSSTNGAQHSSSTAPRNESRETRPGRKPEAVEVTSPKLYVGNLSYDATESDLFELFNGVGVVKSAEIVSHKYNEKSKGFGFVTMSATDEAKRAVTELHDKDFMGRKLVVSGAKTTEREPNYRG